MSITTANLDNLPVATADDLFRISVEDYHAAGDAGILTRDDHVELLEGLVVQKTDYRPQSSDVLIPADEAYYRFSVRQYHELVRLGIITEDDPVELLDGLLVKKMGKNPPHRIVKRLLVRALERIVPESWYVEEQEPITLSRSEPEPDVMIIRGDPRDHLPHPTPPNIGLAVEIADSSLARDRAWKRRLYAKAGIPIYWIVNLADNTIESYHEPASGDYMETSIARAGDQLPVMLDGQTIGSIDVASVLAWSRE